MSNSPKAGRRLETKRLPGEGGDENKFFKPGARIYSVFSQPALQNVTRGMPRAKGMLWLLAHSEHTVIFVHLFHDKSLDLLMEKYKSHKSLSVFGLCCRTNRKVAKKEGCVSALCMLGSVYSEYPCAQVFCGAHLYVFHWETHIQKCLGGFCLLPQPLVTPVPVS